MPALFVEADRATEYLIRRIKHHCSVEQWDVPGRRLLAIAEAWRLAENIRSEGLALVTPLPLTLWSDPLSGMVRSVWVHRGPDQGGFIDPKTGRALLGVSTVGLVSERSSYAVWAEGPLPYTGELEPEDGPDPTEDRDFQRLRHQNRALRAAVDAAAAGGFDPTGRDLWSGTLTSGLVDFRVRGLFSKPVVRVLESKQGGDSKLVLDGQPFGLSEITGEEATGGDRSEDG